MGGHQTKKDTRNRHNDVDPGAIAVLSELVRDPTVQYIFKSVYQLFEEESQQRHFIETNPLPPLTGYEVKKIPTLQQVLNVLQKHNDTTGQTIGATEVCIEGNEKTFAWQIQDTAPHRQLTLLLLDDSIQTFIDQHSCGPEAEYPGLRLRTDEEKKQNPLGHSPERLEQLKQYTGELRGRFLKNFIQTFIMTSAVYAIMIGLFWWVTGHEISTMLAVYGLFLISSFLVSVVLGLQSKLSRIQIAEGVICFYFAGRLRKGVQLALIDGYEHQFGTRGTIRIIYEGHWHCPSGLIDHKQFAELLESCGIHRIDPE